MCYIHIFLCYIQKVIRTARADDILIPRATHHLDAEGKISAAYAVTEKITDLRKIR